MTAVLERAVTRMQECHLQNRHVSYLLNPTRNQNGPASGSRAGMTNELDKNRYVAEHRTFHYRCQQDDSCPFSSVKVITTLELVLGKRHHGRVIRGRICMQPYKDRSLKNALEYHKGGTQGGRVNLRLRIQPKAYSSVNTLLEDPDGVRVRVVIFNVLPSNISEQEIELRFPVGMRVAIRDPLYKVCVDGNTAVRVDNPGDISFFDQSYSDENEKFAADTKNANGEEDLETIGNEGNRLFRDQDWAGAVIKYSQCIDQAVCRGEILKNMKDKTNRVDDVNRVLMLAYSNRAEARLRLADIEDAFSDAHKALEFGPVHVKTLFRKGKAAHGLGFYEKACKLFEAALKQPLQQEEALISKSLEVSLTSLKQTRTGHFDLIAYYSRGGLKCDAPFCADFLGPLKIGRVNYGFGRRGLFATRNVEDGEIMLVSNPLALVWKSLKKECVDNENASRRNFLSQYLLKLLTKRVAASKRHKAQLHSLFSIGVGTQTDVMEIPSMELFTPGSEFVPPHPEKMEDDMDFAYIATLMKLNSFGVNDARLINLRSKRKFDEDDIEVYRGIWVLPSFLNHSCTPNCVAEAVGNAVFVRAIQNIKMGEELTISYVEDLCANVNSRRQSAESNWYFTCKCERCLWEETMKPRLAHVTVACQLLGKAVYAEMSSDKTGVKWQHTRATKDYVRLTIDVEAIIDSLDSKVDLKQRGWIRALFIDVYAAKCHLASDKESKTSLTKVIIHSLYSVSDAVGAHEWLFSQSAPIIEKYFQSRPRPTVPAAWMVGQSYPSLPPKHRPRPRARANLKRLDNDLGRDKEPVSC